MAENSLTLNETSTSNSSQHCASIGCPDGCFSPSTLVTVTPPVLKLFLDTIYTLVWAFTLIGNLLVILVQIFGKKSPKKLRLYLINLAVSDIISGVVCLPFMYVNFVIGEWLFFGWLCPTVEFAQLLSGFVTSLTLAIIGIERYAGTLYPFSRFHFWLRDRPRGILFSVWILGLIYATALIQEISAGKLDFNDELLDVCTYDRGEAAGLSRFKLRSFMIANLIFTFIIPSVVLTVAYSAMIRKFYYSQGEEAANGQESGTWIESIKVVFVIMLCYFVCCSPIKLYQFAVEFDVVMYCTEFQYNLQNYVYIVAHWLAAAHCFINPIIYSFMSQLFRDDLKMLLSMMFPKIFKLINI